MEYLLHLETATKVCSVALSENGQLLGVVETEEEGFAHGENLTLFIDELVKKYGISLKNLSGISVASGPGSYTGLRIGVTTAKGLCYALQIPLIAVDALTSLCDLAQMKYPEASCCAMIDARRMEVFSAIRSGHGAIIKPISADILDEHSYAEFEPFVCVGDGAFKMQDLWKERPVSFDSEIKSSASGQVSKAWEKFQNQEFEDVAYFEPFYLKDFMVGPSKS